VQKHLKGISVKAIVLKVYSTSGAQMISKKRINEDALIYFRCTNQFP